MTGALGHRRAWRVLAQLALLPVLYGLSLPDPEGFGTLVAYALLAGPAVNGAVAGVLVWTSRQAPGVETLRERADDAVTLLLISLGAAGVAVVVILTRAGIEVPGRPLLALLAWALLLVVVPSLGWLRTWRHYWADLLPGRRRQPDEVPPT